MSEPTKRTVTIFFQGQRENYELDAAELDRLLQDWDNPAATFGSYACSTAKGHYRLRLQFALIAGIVVLEEAIPSTAKPVNFRAFGPRR